MKNRLRKKFESVRTISLLVMIGSILAGVIFFSANSWNAIQESFRRMEETHIPVLSNISSATLDISRMRTEVFRYTNDYEPSSYLIFEHFHKAESKFNTIRIEGLPENSKQLFQKLRLQMADYQQMILTLEKHVEEENSIKIAELNNKVAGAGTTLSFIAEKIGANIWERTISVNRESQETLSRNTALLFFISISIVLLLFFGVVYKNRSLQHLVGQRTSELSVQLKELHRIERALRKSEERYRHLTDNLNIGVFKSELKIGGKIIEANPAMADIFEFHTTQELIGSDINLFYLHPEQSQVLAEKSKQQGFLKNEEVEMKTQKGSQLVVRISAIQMKKRETGEEYLMGFLEDISEKIALEKQVWQSQKMESIGTLTGGIAHDFNNILSIMIGNTELAYDALRGDIEATECLDEVIKAGLRAKGVIKQLLGFSRKEQQQREQVDLGEVLEESIHLLRASIPATIEIRKVIEAHLKTVSGDSTQLQLVIINLCNNAMQAMPKGGMLQLMVQNFYLSEQQKFYDLAPGNYVKLTVKDTGEGIKEEDLERIFEPYFTTKDVGKGTGLGLAMAHGIIIHHGGVIQVKSQIDIGTQFDIYIPVSTHDTTVELHPEPSLQKGTEHILIVDDEEALLEFYGKKLRHLGYTVTIQKSSPEALNLVKLDPSQFDLVITDMTMPKMDGLQLTQAIHALRSNIPVVLCTGYSQNIDEIKALDAGVSAFLEKPIETTTYTSTIREVLER